MASQTAISNDFKMKMQSICFNLTTCTTGNNLLMKECENPEMSVYSQQLSIKTNKEFMKILNEKLIECEEIRVRNIGGKVFLCLDTNLKMGKKGPRKKIPKKEVN